jgi:hypothetical protein
MKSAHFQAVSAEGLQDKGKIRSVVFTASMTMLKDDLIPIFVGEESMPAGRVGQ